jgi:threonine aldolase
MPIDLRSDTVTRPTAAMRAAMASAEVGDDTFREDPTVLQLQERIADLTGKEAALFVPSGHMGNQICLRVHSGYGNNVICHSGAHIVAFESGSPCALSGLQPLLIETEDGTFSADQVKAKLHPANIHHSRNRIVAMENTHNRCGGAVWPIEKFSAVAEFGHSQGLAVHLDGARLWNACVSSGTEVTHWVQHVDSVSMCFSKGLGAPVGSVIAGSGAFIDEARFVRKMFGGQMRQAGVLAAAALYALENHWQRMTEDHSNAQVLAALIDEASGLSCIPPQSNIVIFDVLDSKVTAAQLVSEVAQDEVQVFAVAPQRIRAVTHLDVTREQCEAAGQAFGRAMERLTQAAAVA